MHPSRRRALTCAAAAAALLTATLAAPAAVAAPAEFGPSPGAPDGAGLSTTFDRPDPPGGRTLRATDFGATPGNAADDDSAGLQRALDAAGPGDQVVLPDGVYHLKTRNVQLRSGVSLRGESPDGAVLSTQLNQVSGNGRSIALAAAPGVANLTVSDLRVESSGGQELNYGIWLGEGGDAASVSRIALQRVTVSGFLKMGISIRNGDNILVEQSAVRDATGGGGGGQGYGIMVGYDNSHDNVLTGNRLGPGLRHGVVLQYRANHNLVEGNTAEQCGLDCFDLHGEDEHHNELRGNTATGAGEGGFGVGNTGGKPEHFDAGPFNWIHGNTVSGAEFGIHIYRESHDQVVQDNTFTGNDLGMTVRNEGALRVRFAGNTVTGNRAGVRLERAGGAVLTGNIVTGNAGYALKADKSTTGYTITGNDFSGNGSGVELASPDGTFSGNKEGAATGQGRAI